MTGIEKVGVAGFGTMGAGITEVLVRAGVLVVAYAPDAAAAASGRARLEYSTARAVERGKMTGGERESVL